jgi:hypothetical protein
MVMILISGVLFFILATEAFYRSPLFARREDINCLVAACEHNL